MRPKVTNRLYLSGTDVVLAFEFNADWLPAVRRLAQWDSKGKVWRAPLGNIQACLDFARSHRFVISEEADFFRLPPPPVEVERVDVEGNWIQIHFNWETVRAAEVKVIPGCTFDKRRKCWTAPMAALHDVLAWADRHDIEVAPGLQDRADSDAKHREALFQASYRLSFPHRDGMHPDLDAHQRAAVAYVNATRRCFIADDIGLGKTFEVIASLDYTDEPHRPSYPALVVAPPKLTLNWVKEFAFWSPGRTVRVLGAKKDTIEGDPDVVIVGWALLHHFRELLSQRGFRAFVADESHSAKNRTAQRTKAAVTVAKNLAPDAIRLALSGTPMGIATVEFVPQLEMLDLLDEFGGSTGFERAFCGGGLDSAGRWNTAGSSSEEVLNRWLRGVGYIRRLRDEVGDLPPVLHGDILVDGDLRAYRKAETDLIQYVMDRAAEIAAETGQPIQSAMVRAKLKAEAGKHFVQMSALRREAGLAKLPAMHEWIQPIVEADRKLIVAAHHREVVDALAERWGSCKIQGGMSTRDVERAKTDFQEGEAPVVVLSIEAGKEGHTLTAASDVGFAEFPWLSTTYDQTWGRAWRKGQTKRVNVTAVLLRGTKDTEQFDNLGVRRRSVSAATDGSPRDSGTAVLLSLFDAGLTADA